MDATVGLIEGRDVGKWVGVAVATGVLRDSVGEGVVGEATLWVGTAVDVSSQRDKSLVMSMEMTLSKLSF